MEAQRTPKGEKRSSPSSSPSFSAKKSKRSMYCSYFPGQQPNTTLDNDERVWATGYDIFLRATQGKAFWDKPPPMLIPQFQPVLNAKTEFWMKAMDLLPSEILKECDMDSDHSKLSDLLRMYHSGVVFVLLNLPSHIQTFSTKIYKTLRNALESPDFWKYNPIRLVSCLLWAVSVHDKAEEVLEQSMPFTADSLAESLPLLEPPDIQESDVFSQDSALDFLTNALTSGRDAQPFLNFLMSTITLGSPPELMPRLDLNFSPGLL